MPQTRFTPTLFERLLAETPGSPADHLVQSWSIERLKQDVADDIENLLNTRCGWPSERLADYQETSQSVLSYGMVDFAGLSLASSGDRDRICRSIADAIAAHEPRLTDVTVQLASDEGVAQKLCFSIHAKLVVSPASEKVSFDAQLQPATQAYSVALSRRPVNPA